MLKIVCRRPSSAYLRASMNFKVPRVFPFGFSGSESITLLTFLPPNKKSFLFCDTADEDSLRSLDPAGICPDPELQYQAAELSITIEKMIRVLPPSFQPAFEMRYLRELSNERRQWLWT
jgi:hypothetical protein